MAFAASGLFYLTHRDILLNDTAVDLTADSIKCALFTNSITAPAYDTNTAYAAAPFNANEIPNATGYTTGGVVIGSGAISVQTGVILTVDYADAIWTTSTFSGVRGCLIYDDTIAAPVADPALCGVTFGADFAVTAGTFTVQWTAPASGGVWNIDLA